MVVNGNEWGQSKNSLDPFHNEWGQSKNSLDPFQKDPAIMANFYSDPVRLSHSGEFLL
jgi:hypothetical protein